MITNINMELTEENLFFCIKDELIPIIDKKFIEENEMEGCINIEITVNINHKTHDRIDISEITQSTKTHIFRLNKKQENGI